MAVDILLPGVCQGVTKLSANDCVLVTFQVLS